MTVTQGGRRDAVRNYHRILDAARDVLGESGAEASMEEIATRAGVGVGTVYRRFASKDALIDELVRLAMEEVTAAAERTLARADGHGLEEFLRAIGQSFADHARYANLLLERPVDPRATQRLRDAVGELTAPRASLTNSGAAIPLTNLMNVLLISSWDASPALPPPRPGSGCSPRPPTRSPNEATTAPGSPTSPPPRG